MRWSHAAAKLITVFLLLFPAAMHGQEKIKSGDQHSDLPAVIWRNPGDVASLNMIYGAGGQEDAPDPNATYKFRKEVMHGTSPKFDVEDDQHRHWRVKLGQEPQSETAATRLLWAAGYFVDEDYYLPEIKVEGLPRLKRGGSFVSEGGVVRRVRLELRKKSIEKIGTWSWFKNPFVGSKELNGLRVMMALVNNWDLTQINNSIYVVDNQRRYLVSDVGASFGKTGDSIGRSKSSPKGYEETKFVGKIAPNYVDFVMHSRPLFITAINVPNYEKRTHIENVTKHIPRADAKWLGQLLGQLSKEQIRDCFRAAGYNADEVEWYTQAVQSRIADLNAL